MRYSRSPTKDSNSSSQCGTPNEPVSKWKIPHYYRRSSSNHASSAPDISTQTLDNQTPNNNINIMTTPTQVQLEESSAQAKKKTGKGKGKRGEMVFVNYTVKDAKPVDSHLKKKKSPKSRMLKIFSSSNSGSHHDNRLRSMPPLSTNPEAMVGAPMSTSSTPSSSTKRSYASFLRCGRLNSSCSASPSAIAISEEVVPRSAPLPNTQRPQLGRSLSANVSLINNNGRASLSMAPVDDNMLSKKSSSQTSCRATETSDGGEDLDHHYMDQYHGLHDGTEMSNFATDDGHMTFNNLHGTNGMHQSDENDASIAFSKMFTRKRANTGGSMSSLVSSGASSNLPTLHRNLSTNSISSLSNRYSPIRTASPARQTSSIRGSSHRLSRELTSLHSSTGFPVDLSLGLETYLDTQTKQRYNHKRKQDSISELYKSQTNTVPMHYNSTVSSTSSSSTPGVIENAITSNNSNSTDRCNSTMLSLEHENSLENEILEEREDIPPSGDLPAIKGIPRAVKEEQGETIYDAASATNISCSSGTVVSSMTNSQSTLNSSSVSYGNIPIIQSGSTGDRSTATEVRFDNSHSSSVKLENNQDDDFFNMYMELNFENQTELLSERGEVPMSNDSTASRLLEAVHGDTSTVTSLLNTSPTTITTANNVNVANSFQEDPSGTDRLQYSNFTTRIMHDIDQIAQSLNADEIEDDRTHW